MPSNDTDTGVRPLPKGVERVRLWDPALRVFHWSLVICVFTSFGLGKFGPTIMTLHFYVGYVVIALLVFRILWGFVGPEPARFSHFIYGPRSTLGYLQHAGKRAPSYWPGHNPVGALSVFALLAVLGAQVATGLFSDPDDYMNVGPMADMVSTESAQLANRWHYRISWGVVALVVLHLGAISFYKIWKREDLIRPMITGWKLVKHDRQG